ncbi:uncharacterized protein LOC131241308 [Magnolia sinica]|uniref:uncharacterized protein LOC131241308 n=1 Tax=Magnolia sinica TaxID=86752 RepID=UPI00265A2A89|nr:uncharacterized protein LOC131241308 [Magnolia sinica]
MEKTQEEQNPKQSQESKSLVWDCDSSLYDSFELKSFKRQLDSAIASRSLSMAREVDRPQLTTSKRSSKISRSLHKLLRSVFRQKPASDPLVRMDDRSEDGFYVVYQRSGGPLGTKGDDSVANLPEFDLLVRRTKSERFTDAAALRIPCV